MLTAIILPFRTRLRKLNTWFLIISGIILAFLFLLYWKSNHYRIGQLIEYSSQLMTIILAYLVLNKDNNITKYRFWVKIAVAFTFIGHGLYALGYYPQPGHYIDMTINILGVNESQASILLKIMGILDIVAAILILFTDKFKIIIYYIIIWAFLTTMARLVAHFNAQLLFPFLHQWVLEFLIRIPHIALPLIIANTHNSHPKNNYSNN